MDQFKAWIGDYSAQSKVIMRQYIISKGYKSIADVGFGVATEYEGYKNEGYQIDYVGIDSCSILVNRNKSIGIPMIESNCEKIPLPDNSVDVAYSRHVFEHQPSFVGTLAELIRIGRKEAIHVFFINPNVEQIINYDKN
jgi:ubiquinone/menaquinone biosynthesis C-methylase UbiE